MRDRCLQTTLGKAPLRRFHHRETKKAFPPNGWKIMGAAARREILGVRGRRAAPRPLLRSRLQRRCDSFSRSTRSILRPVSNEEKRARKDPHFGARAAAHVEIRTEKTGHLPGFDLALWPRDGGGEHENADRQIPHREKNWRWNAIGNRIQEP